MRTAPLVVAASLLITTGCGQANSPPNSQPPNAQGQSPAFEQQTRAPAINSSVKLEQHVILDGLKHPWALAFLPDGQLLVTERPGRLMRVSPSGQATEVSGVPEVMAQRQGGLLDVTLHPAFSDNRIIYLSYAEPRGRGRNGTSVMRARLADDGGSLTDQHVVFRQRPAWESGLHFGSRLVWDDDNRLFVTLGERGHEKPRQLAQSLHTHLGKVVRINDDGSVPTDNPFTDRDGARPEIWSYGHRNLQGAAIHPQTGQLWTMEHGPRGGDELNTPQPGLNYGWPVITYGEDYSGEPIGQGITAREGMQQPRYYWDPVIAPGGMAFCADNCPSAWRGNLLISSLNPGGVVRLALEGDRVTGEERLLTGLGRVRDLDFGPDGNLWLVTDSGNGKLLRFSPAQ